MIIHDLTVRGWRRFREQIELSFDRNLNIIFGPNESGKSTLIEALTRALFDKHSVTGREMDSLRPWGSTLTPEVTVVFSAGDGRYRLRKRFLDSPSSELWSRADGRWQLTADGDAADRKVLEFTGGKLPGRGVTRPHHRGLAEALWARQQDHDIPSEWNPEVLNHLEKAIGEVMQSTTSSSVEQLISQRHLELLTRVRGQPAAGGALDQAKKELRDLEEELERVKEQRVDLHRRMDDLSNIQSEAHTLERRMEEAEDELQQAREAREAAREHQEMRLNARTAHLEAEKHWEELNRRVKEIKEARKAAEKLLRQIEDSSSRKGQVQAEITSAQQRQKEFEEQLDGKRRAERQVQDRLDALNALDSLRSTEAESARYEKAAVQAAELQCRLKETENTLTDGIFPTEETLEKTTQLQEKIHEGEAVLRTQGLTIEITPEAELEAQVQLDGDEEQSRQLRHGHSKIFTAANEADLIFPGLVGIEIHSGNERAAEAVQKLRENRESLSDMLAAHNVSSVEQLSDQHQRHRTLVQQFDDLQEKLQGLPEEGDEAEIERQLRQVRNRRKRLLEELDGADLPDAWWEHPPEVLDELIEEHTEKRRKLQHDIKTLEEQAESSREPVEQLKEELAEVEREISVMQQQKQDRLDGAAELEQQDEFCTEDERAAALRRASVKAERARQAWKELEREKAEKEDEPEKLYEEAARRRDQLRKQESDLQRTEAGHLEVLQAASASNVREREGDLEARVHSTRKTVERLERDAEAYRLLDHLLAAHRREQMRSLGGPVKELVDQWTPRLLGGEYSGVEFSPELTPHGLQVEHPEVTASLETDLSYGAHEQLNFLVRLAVGVVLSREEPHMVVLDDRLTNTDPGRLKRARDILAEAGERMQIVLLTCFPDHYSGLDGKFIDMRQLTIDS